MQLGTTVTKQSEQAEDPIQNMNSFRYQLQFMPLTLCNNGSNLDCYDILDPCSSCSYILSKTAETLQCKPSQQLQLSLRGAFSKVRPHNATKPTFTLKSIYSVEDLSFDRNIDTNNLNKTCSLYNHLRHNNFPDLGDNTVEILLGVDVFWKIAELDITKGPTGTPVKNLLGWTITCPLNQKSNSSGPNSHSTKFIDLNDQENANLTELVEKFWKVEESGIHEVKKAIYSDKSNRQLRFLEKSVEHDGDRCKINLLWKNELKLPNN